MKDLQANDVRVIEGYAQNAIEQLERIVKECDQIYQSRRYIIDKATNAKVLIDALVEIANGDV